MGQLEILSAGHGGKVIHFTNETEQDVKENQELIEDLLKKGYAIFVHFGGDTLRVRSFDPRIDSYIVREKEPVARTEGDAVVVPPMAGG